MKHIFGYAIAVAAIFCAGLMEAAAAVDVSPYVKNDRFESLQISPTGEYYAAAVPLEDRTVLVVMRRGDNAVTGTLNLGKNTHIHEFTWVNADRLIIGTSEKFGLLEQPVLTGELYGMNANGGQVELLVGQRMRGEGLGTKIQKRKVEHVAAFLIDTLPAEEKNVLISVSPFNDDPFTRVDKMDVNSGRRIPVARAPVRNARFTADNAGVVRFALGAGVDLASKLYYRDGEGAEWRLVNDENATDRVEVPLGFSEDNKTAYLRAEQDKGPDVIVALDVASGTRKTILRDDNTDPLMVIRKPGTRVPVGAVFMDGKPRNAFFDESSEVARLYRSLEAAFGGLLPYITSSTADGKLTLVQTYSDRNPGDFYVFDTQAKKADYVISRREWFDPDQMAEMRPISLVARDGTPLAGYLTVPRGSDGRNLPVVVVAHGGPYGEFDTWEFNGENQMLAAAGYGVLQVNFRGSGNHGRAFTQAGAKQWGGTMQDDVTDATRWAIQQGIANPRRICIYGASYGAYAALMGVAKEPALYQCAVGYVGVYDLPTMHTHGDIQNRGSGATYLRDWIGERDALGAVSPNRMADRIKVPVMLAAGGEDERAPIEHSKMMEKALVAAGVPVETLYFPREGHGFYVEANRKAYYSKLLSFLGKHIGAAPQGGNAAAGASD
ncbi:alpha/beta hydrolase family protein [Luteimonas vadosa]|uniref:S9 family peptidase n=1 Tax=Luteimonas vadosa TaxID=1165507 RepID=A0ABP9E3F1_9GAMM